MAALMIRMWRSSTSLRTGGSGVLAVGGDVVEAAGAAQGEFAGGV